MKRVIYVTTNNDWEGIYIDGILHDEEEKLGEGNNFFYLLNLAEEFGFMSDEIETLYSTDKLEEYLDENFSLPETIEELTKLYD